MHLLGISKSAPNETCNPILGDVNSEYLAVKASFLVGNEPFTEGRLSNIPRIVNLLDLSVVANIAGSGFRTCETTDPVT